MAWFVWPPSADPDAYRERGRWEADRPIARGDRWHPEGWPSREPDEAPPGQVDEDDDGPDPSLRTRPKVLVYLGTIAVWLPIVTVLHVHWWTFERSMFVSVFAPFLLAGGVERVVLRLRPDLDRHHDPEDPDGLVRGRRRAAQLGEAARPYWAREGAEDRDGEGSDGDGGEDGGSPSDGRPAASDVPAGRAAVRDDRPGV